MLVTELLRECERTFVLDFDLELLIEGLGRCEAGSIIMNSYGNGAEPGVAKAAVSGGLVDRRSRNGLDGRYPPIVTGCC